MAKLKLVYTCQNCAHCEFKWKGQCSECGEWNSFVEVAEGVNPKKTSVHREALDERPKLVSEIKSEFLSRIKSGVSEFDRVTGGGVAKGSLILIGGEPGIGKSTLLMKACAGLSRNSANSLTLYASGEESEGQIAKRSERLGIRDNQLLILNTTDWDQIKLQLEILKPEFLVIDSIQTISSNEVNSAPGSITQIREVTHEILNYCKRKLITTFIVGHVTKDGGIAGPKILEHMVDVVIYFEGDKQGEYRILRVIKNRFGNTNEIGIFEMTDNGLEEVEKASQYFLGESHENVYGKSISCIAEGSRTIFLEIQALVLENKFSIGRRVSQGIDSNRISMLVAVVEKYLGIPLSSSDVYTNIIGGIKLNSRDIDLSIVASLLSSFKKLSLSSDTIFLGEVGLNGEVRSVPRIEARVREMEYLSYKTLVTGMRSANILNEKTKLRIVGIKNVVELMNFVVK